VDTLNGGAGNDVYIDNDAEADTINEAAGAGLDEVRTSNASYTLTAANVEVLTGTLAVLPGQTGQALTGSATNNLIQGTLGADVLSGAGGDDILVGLGGSDTFDGGAGSDTVVLMGYGPLSFSRAGGATTTATYTDQLGVQRTLTFTDIENFVVDGGSVSRATRAPTGFRAGSGRTRSRAGQGRTPSRAGPT
jgi:Ca2+-binding RTX toxin-like protein